MQLYLLRWGSVIQHEVSLDRIDEINVCQIDDEASSDRYEYRLLSPHLIVYDRNELLAVEP